MIAAGVAAALAGSAVAAHAIASGSGARPAAKPTAGSTVVARCTLSDLHVHRIGSYAGLGESGGYYGLTNVGRRSCSVKGWPYVAAIKADGTRASGKLVQYTFYGPFKAPLHPPTIHLRPGATAAFALTTGDNPLDNARRCPAPYTRLQIGLVKGSASTTIWAWIPYYGQFFQACTGYAVSEIVAKSDLHG